MSKTDWIFGLFDAIDRKDIDAFVGYLADDVTFRFGNAPPTRGRDATRMAVAGFFAAVPALRHKLQNTWHSADHVLCRGHVTYTRSDHSTLTVPFANVFLMRSGKIVAYEIYTDIHVLFAA